MNRKQLRTTDQQFEAYPEHKKLFDLDQQIKGAEATFRAFESQGAILCDSSDRVTTRHGDYAYRPFADRRFDRYSHSLQDFIFKAVGIDPAKIWAEKADMLEQLDLAWQAADDPLVLGDNERDYWPEYDTVPTIIVEPRSVTFRGRRYAAMYRYEPYGARGWELCSNGQYENDFEFIRCLSYPETVLRSEDVRPGPNI